MQCPQVIMLFLVLIQIRWRQQFTFVVRTKEKLLKTAYETTQNRSHTNETQSEAMSTNK